MKDSNTRLKYVIVKRTFVERNQIPINDVPEYFQHERTLLDPK